MAKTLQFKRYTNSSVAATTGAAGELIVDTNQNTITVHDGSTVGGTALATQAQLNANVSMLQGIENTQNTNIQLAWNSANAAFNAANVDLDGPIYSTANASYVTANAAYNQANTGTVLAQAAFNKANTGGGGGGGSSTSNGFITVATSDQFKTLGTPTDVQYVASSNYIQIGPIAMGGSGNTTDGLTTTANTYIDVGAWSYSMPSIYNYNYGYQGLVITRNTGIPAGVAKYINSLQPGSQFNLTFAAGDINNQLDQFTVTFTVGSLGVIDTTVVNTLTGGYWPASQPDIVAGSYGWSGSWAGKSPTIWVNNYVVQPLYTTSSITSTNTQLVGQKYGNPIHYNFLINCNGQGVLQLQTIFRDQTSGNAGSHYVGAVSLSFPQTYGTVATFAANTYQNVLSYANSIAINNTVGGFSVPVISYDSANSKVLLSTSNITSQVTTSTPIQAYVGAEYSPVMTLGESVSIVEDLNNSRAIVVGNLAKASSLTSVGTVLSACSTPGLVNTAGTWTPVETNNSYASYTNGLFWYPSTPTNNNAFSLINVTPALFNQIGANGTQFFVSHVYNNTISNTLFQVTNTGTNGLPISGYWSSGNSAGNYVQMKMLYTKAGTSNSTSSFSNWTYTDWSSTAPLQPNVVIHVPQNTISLTVSSSSIPTFANYANNGTTIYIEGYPTTVYSVNAVSNTVITTLPASVYANTNFTNSSIVTISNASPLATISDIANNIPTWVATVTNSITTDTQSNPTGYYVGTSNSGFGLQQFNINNIIAGSSSRNTSMQFQFQNNNYISAGDLVSNSWNQNQYQAWGDASVSGITSGTKYGAWFGSLYANTIMGTSGTLYSTNSITDIQTVGTQIKVLANGSAEDDPYIANVAILLNPYQSTGLYNDCPSNAATASAYWTSNQGMNPTIPAVQPNQPVVPPGAPSWARSILFGAWNDPVNGTYGGGAYIPNTTSVDIGSGTQDWTIESWVCLTGGYSNINLMNGVGYFDLTQQGNIYLSLQFPFYGYATINNTSTINSYLASYGPHPDLANGYVPNAGEWYHVAYTYSAGTQVVSMFMNGVLVAYGNGYTFTSTSTQQFGLSTTSTPTWYYNYRMTYGVNRYPSGLGTGTKYFTPSVMPFGYSARLGHPVANAAVIGGGVQMQSLGLSGNGSSQITTNTRGGTLYVNNGNLFYRGANGTTTLIANA